MYETELENELDYEK